MFRFVEIVFCAILTKVNALTWLYANISEMAKDTAIVAIKCE